MKISAFQMNIAPTVAENLDKVAKKTALLKGATDILILPEMFTTGFSMDSENISEQHDTTSLAFIKKCAAKSGIAIGGSIATKEDGKYYNRFYFVEPSGAYTSYDKRHLFRMGDEHNHYTAGDKRVIVEYKGVRILLQVCYDLRFPIWSRNVNDYDMAFYIASWPASRVKAWEKLLEARAIENQIYVVGVNRVGNFDGLDYCGGTHIIDFKGERLVSAQYNKEEVIESDLSIESLSQFKEVFPAYLDADNFTIK